MFSFLLRHCVYRLHEQLSTSQEERYAKEVLIVSNFLCFFLDDFRDNVLKYSTVTFPYLHLLSMHRHIALYCDGL